MRYARQHMDTLSASPAACPVSSNAITTTAAPWRLMSSAFCLKASSPSFRLMLLTMHLPWAHLRPASTMGNLDESIMNGTRLISGSAARGKRWWGIQAWAKGGGRCVWAAWLPGSLAPCRGYAWQPIGPACSSLPASCMRMHAARMCCNKPPTCNAEVDKLGHGRHAVNQAVVHVDVQHISALLHLSG